MIKRVHFKSSWLAYAFVLPQIAITLVFFIWPAVLALKQAFYRQDAWGINPPTFVGFAQFESLFSDPEYLHTLWRTLWFSAAITVLSMAVALLLAAIADTFIKRSRWYRTLLIIPYAVAPVLAGALWFFLLNPSLGIVAGWLGHFGIHWNPKINGGQAAGMLIIAGAWNYVSYNFLFFLAGMQSIPKSLIEAAAIDGAGPIRRFRDVVLPLISPTIFFLIVMNVVYAFFDTFSLIDGVTQGGPGNSTTTLVYQVFQDGYIGHQYGKSAAESVLMILLVSILTVIQFRYVERKVSYA